jgi:N-carbamoylputrescine amidase
MSQITVAALQLAAQRSGDEAENIVCRVDALVEDAAAQRELKLVLPPELFAGPYFCKVEEDEALFALAKADRNRASRLSGKCRQACQGEIESIAIPTSFFERDGQHYYNTLAMIGPDGDDHGHLSQEPYPRWPGL